ncbi:MAG: zinc metalloprotease HtpX [Candidatus Taylorbacteria bacterium RIFCSPHIGHO2_01_FULL_51_15]|uniref:Protease HtpX homolog n=1 Tax=Candidatus Taylorbacteria bacterium RIFCSPHIGHO2_01_FULL_51_15 TaxID=1802304 RepID=A0A1G2MC32_9BACT|nr:MAG: zinc metalloprotease HtpX [Candidatus Taylorbacteria bacterium RIFCSPHIGHO2_01_FULL_51_15]
MPSLYTHQSQNVAKTWILMAVFFAIIIFLGWFLSQYYGNPAILYGFFIFSVLMNIASYWWSDKIVLKMSGAKPARREEFFDLYTVTENLSIAAGLPMPKLYVIQDPAPNAFATGRNKEHAVVAATTGLLQILDRSELEGVIAHELSHIGNRDILISTVVVVLVGFITLLADFFTRSLWFGGGGRRERGGGQLGAILMIVGIVLTILSPIIATLMQLAISRKREFLADASGALLTRYPEGLASALQKIAQYSRPMMKANHATAHLFIANPFGHKANGGVSFFTKIFSTHPPVAERVKALLGEKQ